MMTPATQKVWFITGCSSGIGRELALAALTRGDLVIATARNVRKLEELERLGASAIALDVTASDETITTIVAQAIEIHGRVDILVNNAGYTLEGAIEECRCVCVHQICSTGTNVTWTSSLICPPSNVWPSFIHFY